MEQFHGDDFNFNEPLKNTGEQNGQTAYERPQQDAFANPPAKTYSGKSIAAMILGIAGILFTAIFFVSLPCAILALIFGKSEEKAHPNGMAKAGFILGIIGLVLTVILLILFLILFSVGLSLAQDWTYDWDYSYGDTWEDYYDGYYDDYYDDYYDYAYNEWDFLIA